MDLNEFKKRLMSEPDSTDPEMLAAREESSGHREAALVAEAFEAKLRAALETPVDPGLGDRIRSRVTEAPQRPAFGWALAASLAVVALSLAVVIGSRNAAPESLEVAFVEHFEHPESGTLDPRDPYPGAVVRTAFAEFGADLAVDLNHVTFMRTCRIGGKRGLHLVMTEGDKRVTLMFLPGESLGADADIDFAPVTARMIEVPGGVLALFGHQGQPVDGLSRHLKGAFRAAHLASL